MFNAKDLIQAENLIKILRKGKWELEFEEILAFNQVFLWAVQLNAQVKEDIKKAEEPLPPKGKTK
jgi:hypothetical protein